MRSSLIFKFAAVTGALLSVGLPARGQNRTYTKTQISSGAFDHESPSINNAGDVVWSQQVGAVWQVYILRAGATVPVPVAGQAPDHNNTNPTIDDAGDVMYLKDGVGQGVALAVILNRGGTESIVEFSSRNSLTGQHRDAGQHFGISSTGTTISYYDFLQFGFGPRRFNVSGAGQLPGDFTGKDFPDINSNGTFVFSSFGTVFSAPVSAPDSPTAIASGDKPRIADVVPPATAPEIVYISGGNQVVSTQGGVVDAGSWADVNRAGAIAYEKTVSGMNQVFLAVPNNAVRITTTSLPSVISGAVYTAPLAATGGVPPYTWSATALPVGFSVTGSDIISSGVPAAAPRTYNVTVRVSDTTGGTDSAVLPLVVSPSQLSLRVVAQHPFQGSVRQQISSPLQVAVTDTSGNAVGNVPISFSLTQEPTGSTGASITTSSSQTDMTGIASTQLTLGNKPGVYVVTASCSTCTPATVTMDALAGCALPRSVPSYSQGGGTWGSQVYDNYNSLPNTIGRWGCALTSLTMALDYLGQSYDPGSLNNVLKAPAGGYTGHVVDWGNAVPLAAPGTTLHYDNLGGYINSDVDFSGALQAVEDEVCAVDPHPVITAVRSPTNGRLWKHFVLITGLTTAPDGTPVLSINDPAGAAATLNIGPYANPQTGRPEFSTRGIVNDPEDLSGMTVAVNETAGLTVTDNLGRHSGVDPTTGTITQQIPHSAAATDEIDDDIAGNASTGAINFVNINQLQSPSYTVVVKGVADGTFTLSVKAVTSNGAVQPPAEFTGRVAPGSLTTIAITDPSSPGTPPSLGQVVGDVNGDSKVDCTDLAIVRAAFGKRASQAGFDPRADLNFDGLVDIRDLATVAQKLPAGTQCQ